MKTDDGLWRVQERPLLWDAQQTAVVICDTRDDHYCRKSARRVAELAPHINRVVSDLRRRAERS